VLGIIPFIFAFSNYYLSTKFLVYLSFGWFSSLFLRFLVIGVVEEELLARSIVASFPVVWLLFVFTIGRQTSSEGRL
jgi:Na+/pantothenate symporter